MKIAFFSDVFLPEPSGIAISIIDLGKILAERGHDIRFYVPYYSPRDYRFVGLEPKEYSFHSKIQIIRLPSIPFRFGATGQARMILPYASSLQDIKAWSPNILHTQLFFGGGLEALRVKRALRIPLIGTNHTAVTEFAHYSPIHLPLIENSLMQYAVWYYNQCNFLTAPSNSVIQEMNRYGNKTPGIAMSNPIDTNLFTPPKDSVTRDELRKKWNITGPSVLYVGRLSPEKQVAVVIRSFAELKKKISNAILIIIGKGVQKEELEALARKLGIEDSVRFLGFIDRGPLTEIYKAIDAFAVASTSETQCLTLMEAMSSGVLPVGVKARALPEYIPEEFGFLVEPGDAPGMAEKLFTLLTLSPVELLERKKKARLFAEGFTAQAIADKWEKLYKEYEKHH